MRACHSYYELSILIVCITQAHFTKSVYKCNKESDDVIQSHLNELAAHLNEINGMQQWTLASQQNLIS